MPACLVSRRVEKTKTKSRNLSRNNNQKVPINFSEAKFSEYLQTIKKKSKKKIKQRRYSMSYKAITNLKMEIRLKKDLFNFLKM